MGGEEGREGGVEGNWHIPGNAEQTDTSELQQVPVGHCVNIVFTTELMYLNSIIIHPNDDNGDNNNNSNENNP